MLNQNRKTDADARNSEEKAPVREPLNREAHTPLFLRDGSENKKGNAQDEKDKSAE